MLLSLLIKNFAIVEQSELQLNTGLTIITGETGAGKSILIDALGLVLGERADSSVVRQGSDTAYIEAIFQINTNSQQWLKKNNLSIEKQKTCRITRTVTQNGRSKATINNRNVSVQTLREFGGQLVDIHGQHAHQSLLKNDIQRQLLDDMVEDKTILQEVATCYEKWKDLQTALTHLGGATQDRESRLALLRYQVQELENFELTPEAIKNIEEEHRRLANATQLLSQSQRALALLDAEDADSTLSYLNQASHELESAQHHDTQLSSVTNLLSNAMIQTQEAVGELRHYLHTLEIDPARLQWVEQQLADLQDMARKHKIKVPDLPNYYAKLKSQLDDLENYEQRAQELEADLAKSLKIYQQAAEKLHQQRLDIAQTLSEQITVNMRQLGMPGGYVVISVTHQKEAIPSQVGIDNVEFLVSANLGHVPKPLNRVASGGELSRISLAIQVIVAQTSGVATLVFDEVDVGIGGGVAEIVGKLLNQLGQQRQVLCITHLPQVAAQGQQHLQVIKTMAENSTHTQLHWLNNQQRIEEIARMLGGLEITAQTLAHAKEMLQRNYTI